MHLRTPILNVGSLWPQLLSAQFLLQIHIFVSNLSPLGTLPEWSPLKGIALHAEGTQAWELLTPPSHSSLCAAWVCSPSAQPCPSAQIISGSLFLPHSVGAWPKPAGLTWAVISKVADPWFIPLRPRTSSAEGGRLRTVDSQHSWLGINALFLKRNFLLCFCFQCIKETKSQCQRISEMVKPHQPATIPLSKRALRQNCEALRKELKTPFRLVWCPHCT